MNNGSLGTYNIERVRSDLWVLRAPSYLDALGGPCIGAFQTHRAALAARKRALKHGDYMWTKRFGAQS